ncbi:potassium transporter [Anoxybacter fermentans]|uniref:Potassium transporter n=1 Tax=Anoxybacter fermentans TaxID=1323375 RepID=A0A3Q9HPQ2_9FIRM|nr:TrkH family potassium uptake protein [Anoxybacter fermentans]AZR72769.1 potassium transporter [Anoxybacter fermentans]
MRIKVILHIIGGLLILLGFSLMFPVIVGLYYGETDAIDFLLLALFILPSGFVIYYLFRSPLDIRYPEGFLIVTISWLVVSVVGAIPFITTHTLTNFADAFFESVSGFTTTGATVIMSLEHVSQTILFWRSLSHWMGGMGIIVMSMAILPELAGKMQLFKAEVPGPMHERLKPRIRETARTLFWIYFSLTVIQLILLYLNGMSLFDAIIHSFGTVSTGGFSSRTLSVRAYNSDAVDWIVTIFMFLAGVNLALYYQTFRGKVKVIFKNQEFRVYTGIVLTFTLFITINLRLNVYQNLYQSFKYAAFQVVSIITTTGYSIVDYDIWPPLSHWLLLLLMFIGGCAGSTAGGIKIIRIYTLIKKCRLELFKLRHPRAVNRLTIGKDPISEEVSTGILEFFFLYILVFAITVICLTSYGVDLISAISAVAATLGNIGPGLELVGPLNSFMPLPNTVKFILSGCMLMGRLEIYTVLVVIFSGFSKK